MKNRLFCLGFLTMAALSTAAAQFQTPHIQAVNPPSMAPGAQVKLTITGYGFNNGPSVQINGSTVPSTLVSQIDLQVNYTAPSSPTGLLVTVSNDVGAISNAVSVPVSTHNPNIGMTAPGEFSYMFAGLAIASFNGDGHPEIATTARGSFEPSGDAFLIVLNAETGTNGPVLQWGPHDYDFTASLQYPTSDYASAIATGDFNGDGRPDVVIATACGAGATACTGNTDLYLAVLLNQSAGSRATQKFSSPVLTPLPAQATALAIGNFTGAGTVDLAVAAGDSIYLYKGEGNGLFQQVSTFSANLGTPVLGLVAADFNQDGISDILAITSTSEELVLSIGGEPNFSATSISDAEGPIQVVLGDFNNDGLVDAAVLESSSVKIFSSAGNGTFNTYTAAQAPPGTTALQAGDFNTDGYLDLMLFGSSASVLVNDGDGAWPAVITPNAYGQFYPSATLAAADFNLDGKVDIASIGQNSTDLAVYFQGSAITFSPPSLVINEQAPQTSPPQTVTVSSTGSLPLIFSGTPMITDESGLGYFILGSDNCPATLAAGSSCQVQLAYNAAPYVGDVTANLTFYGNAGGSLIDEENYSLVGNNLVSLGALSGKLAFPNTVMGTTSASMTETLESNGSEALAISSITIQPGTNAGPNDFKIVSNSCGAQLAENAACQIAVTFTPSTEKAETATLTVADNNSNQSTNQTAKLTGTGVGPNVPDLTFSTNSLAFGNLQVGQTSGTASAVVTNIGADPVVFTAVAITGTNPTDFALVAGANACTYGSSSLAAGATCNVYVTFAPKTNGALSAAVTLTDNNLGVSGATQAISLSGSAGYPAPFLDSLSPVSLLSSAANGGFTLTLEGANFNSASVVRLNGQALTTSVTGAGIEGVIPAGLITGAGTQSITVDNPGDAASNVMFLPTASAATGTPEYINAPGSPFSAIASVQQLTVGDFNGDGKPDLVATNGGATVVYLSQGNGTFTQSAELSAAVVYPSPGEPVTVAPFSTVAGDFNGDGKLDIAVLCQPFGVVIWLGNGQGGFAPQQYDPQGSGLPLGNMTGGEPQFGTTADFNNDGILDIATANLDGTISILIGQGNAALNPFYPITTNQGAPWDIVAGDFNGDGNVDLAVSNFQANTVVALLGNGQGGFAVQPAVATGSQPLGLASGDFNGDGKLDLAVANSSSNTVSILLGIGNGTFTAVAAPATGAGPGSIAVGDLNGDGKLDMAVANMSGNSVTILVGKGDGTFTAAGPAVAAGTNPQSVSLADWNDDGMLDVATANANSASISVLLGAVAVATPSTNSLSFGSQNARVASAAQNVVLVNTGSGPLTLTGIAVSGANAADFPQTNTCGTLPAQLAAGASCTVSVTFDPSIAGAESAALTFTDNSNNTPGSSQAVSLSGTGVVTVTLAPTAVSFGKIGVSESSPKKYVRVTNASAIAVAISKIGIVGKNSSDFTAANDCGATLGAGASCLVVLVFKPAAAGPCYATLRVADDGTGSPQSAALTGTGTE
ncbi:MAG: FG-GAP-like repeat-containing protein [Bryobacteraceae bacterium]